MQLAKGVYLERTEIWCRRIFMKKIYKLKVEIALVLFIITCAIALIFYCLNFGNNGLSDITNDWGLFGDYFGGVIGTLISFVTIFLIYLTYTNQVRSTEKQQFETTFFSLLENQRDILKSLKGNIPKEIEGEKHGELEAYEFISGVASQLNLRLDVGIIPVYEKEQQLNIEAKPKEINEKNIDLVYKDVFIGKEAQLGHYFRHLYHIIKFTNESSIEDKKRYIDFIQAQMSDDELYVAFYNGICEYGKDKFLELLDRYGFFENVASRGAIFDLHAQQFYPKTIFKSKAPIIEDAN